MLKAVLFDMDGVIVDTEPLHKKAYFKMFEEVGITVPNDLYASFTGQSTLEICERLVSTYSLKQHASGLVSMKRKHFKYLFENDHSLQLIDGVLDCIKDYYTNGVTLVVASSASMENINRVFDRFDLNRYFTAKLSGADLQKSKPHPEIFLKAAQAAKQPKEQCIVIEDSTNGVEAAYSAGIFCIGYNSFHSKNQDYSKASTVVNDLNDIPFSVIKDWV